MLKEDVEKLEIEGDVSADEKTLNEFSKDASIFEIRPEVVIAPKNVGDIKKLVVFASNNSSSDNKVSITPRSGGTDMSGGSINDSIILDFTKYFNHFSVEGSCAYTEPGVFYREFEKETLKHGLIFPSFPASKDICAMGGIIGNNAAGEKTLSYGKTERYVKELNVVLADGNEYEIKALHEDELQAKLKQQDFEGELYRKTHRLLEENYEIIEKAKPNVSKNSAGYYLWNVWDKEKRIFDLTKLFVGSQGTLGIITKAKLQLVPVTKESRLLVAQLPDLKHLAEIVNTILPFQPETFESYDDETLKIAVRYLPEIIKAMHPKNKLGALIQLWPEVKMSLKNKYPRLVLMAEFSGDNLSQIENRVKEAEKALKPFNIKTCVTKTTEENKKYWTIRHESFNLLRKHSVGKHAAPFIEDVIVRHEHLPEFLPQLDGILKKYNLSYTIAGHVGDGNFHIFPLMDYKDGQTKEIISKLSQEVYALVLTYHGSTSAEHNDGLIRSHFLPYMFGKQIYDLFVETKKIFDPLNIFNPGKKIDTSWQYALDHIINE